MEHEQNSRAEKEESCNASSASSVESEEGTDSESSDKMSTPEKLTPYQGKRRSFGFFRCPKCRDQAGRSVEWASASSWANTYQKCKTCYTAVYPYRQLKLEKGAGSKERKPHARNLCQRCIETGWPCY
ncbi:zinc finger CCHC domain-containing protein 24-like [Eriocheir sinensis]|uniref:zinc finger CCHC domain-containing protein 24-like n=1 Tax=Eriocheir sinensis TaxID=95602 RepID=UPI0021C7EC61|nr:zinc finger CCHC domain-containing protein 24-like [Eriocheir sinensis]